MRDIPTAFDGSVVHLLEERDSPTTRCNRPVGPTWGHQVMAPHTYMNSLYSCAFCVSEWASKQATHGY